MAYTKGFTDEEVLLDQGVVIRDAIHGNLVAQNGWDYVHDFVVGGEEYRVYECTNPVEGPRFFMSVGLVDDNDDALLDLRLFEEWDAPASGADPDVYRMVPRVRDLDTNTYLGPRIGDNGAWAGGLGISGDTDDLRTPLIGDHPTLTRNFVERLELSVSDSTGVQYFIFSGPSYFIFFRRLESTNNVEAFYVGAFETLVLNDPYPARALIQLRNGNFSGVGSRGHWTRHPHKEHRPGGVNDNYNFVARDQDVWTPRFGNPYGNIDPFQMGRVLGSRWAMATTSTSTSTSNSPAAQEYGSARGMFYDVAGIGYASQIGIGDEMLIDGTRWVYTGVSSGTAVASNALWIKRAASV